MPSLHPYLSYQSLGSPLPRPVGPSWIHKTRPPTLPEGGGPDGSGGGRGPRRSTGPEAIDGTRGVVVQGSADAVPLSSTTPKHCRREYRGRPPGDAQSDRLRVGEDQQGQTSTTDTTCFPTRNRPSGDPVTRHRQTDTTSWTGPVCHSIRSVRDRG